MGVLARTAWSGPTSALRVQWSGRGHCCFTKWSDQGSGSDSPHPGRDLVPRLLPCTLRPLLSASWGSAPSAVILQVLVATRCVSSS